MLTPSLEDYLEEIYRRSREGGVRPKDLALALNVSMPAVTKALQRLSDLECVYYRAYVEVILTEKGESLGAYLVHRNEVLLRFVSAVCPECDAPEAVESMEHYIVPELVHGLSVLMGFLSTEDVRKGFGEYLEHAEPQSPLRTAMEAMGKGTGEIPQMRRFGGKARVHPDPPEPL